MSLSERYQGVDGERNIQEALQQHKSLQNDSAVIERFIKESALVIYEAGAQIIRKGDTDRDIIYILAGEVQIEVNGDVSKHRYAGDHIGEMSLVDASSVRSATVRAVTETAVLKVHTSTFSDLADATKGFLWKNIAKELAYRLRQRLEDIQPPRRLVLLVHGIRTRAEWQQMVKTQLEDEYTKVIPIKYGFLDLLRFWFPVFTRNFAIRRLEEKICRSIYDHLDREVVVIAHSFGTYAISKILARNPLIKIHRLILCGSIVSSVFKWGSLPNRPNLIVNDCGNRDWYPILASLSTFGYEGATGVFGHGTSEITDRFFDFNHSDFFNEDFVDSHWKPFVQLGRIENSMLTVKTKSWLMSVAADKWVVAMILALLCALSIAAFGLVYFLHSFANNS